MEAVYSQHSKAIHSLSMAGYVTAVLAFVREELISAWEASSFYDLKKSTSSHFTTFFSFLTQIFVFLDVIHLDALDFSECRSEEVKSFF